MDNNQQRQQHQIQEPDFESSGNEEENTEITTTNIRYVSMEEILPEISTFSHTILASLTDRIELIRSSTAPPIFSAEMGRTRISRWNYPSAEPTQSGEYSRVDLGAELPLTQDALFQTFMSNINQQSIIDEENRQVRASQKARKKREKRLPKVLIKRAESKNQNEKQKKRDYAALNIEALEQKSKEELIDFLETMKKEMIRKCVICFESFEIINNVWTVVSPCGHQICDECAKELFLTTGKCWCRKDIEKLTPAIN